MAIRACWSEIGVQGDRSCPELVKHVHCRNCPVYAKAARELLDVPVGDDYVAEWTGYYANEAVRDEPADALAFVFRVGVEWLALPIATLDSVVDLRPIHSLPHCSDGAILGLVNVRGVLIVCVSLHRLLGVAEGPVEKGAEAKFARFIVVQQGERRFALGADEVHGTERYSSHTLTSMPATAAMTTTIHTQAMLPWRDKSVGLLDPQSLFAGVERSLA
jgi:chemotaxis-related protein WspD